MASEAEISNGRYTGNIVGTLLPKEQVERLQQWLANYDGDTQAVTFTVIQLTTCRC